MVMNTILAKEMKRASVVAAKCAENTFLTSKTWMYLRYTQLRGKLPHQKGGQQLCEA